MKILLNFSLIFTIIVVVYSADPRCPPDEDENSLAVLLPHESDCSLYYACVHGDLLELQCPPGMYFNPELSVSLNLYSIKYKFYNSINFFVLGL